MVHSPQFQPPNIPSMPPPPQQIPIYSNPVSRTPPPAPRHPTPEQLKAQDDRRIAQRESRERFESLLELAKTHVPEVDATTVEMRTQKKLFGSKVVEVHTPTGKKGWVIGKVPFDQMEHGWTPDGITAVEAVLTRSLDIVPTGQGEYALRYLKNHAVGQSGTFEWYRFINGRLHELLEANGISVDLPSGNRQKSQRDVEFLHQQYFDDVFATVAMHLPKKPKERLRAALRDEDDKTRKLQMCLQALESHGITAPQPPKV